MNLIVIVESAKILNTVVLTRTTAVILTAKTEPGAIQLIQINDGSYVMYLFVALRLHRWPQLPIVPLLLEKLVVVMMMDTQDIVER
jgi:hypothetical protein